MVIVITLKRMQQITLAIFMIFGAFFAPAAAASTGSASPGRVIGSVVKLELSVPAGPKEVTDWSAADSLVLQSRGLILLSIRPGSNDHGRATREILFTTARPGDLLITALPVTVQGKKYITKPLLMHFRPDKIPPSLLDIQPVMQARPDEFLKAVGKTALVLLLTLFGTLGGWLIVRGKLARWRAVRLKGLNLQLLSQLENELENKMSPDGFLLERLNELLGEVSPPAAVSERIRRLNFMPAAASKVLLPGLFRELRQQIANDQTKNSSWIK
jgi:hypothetical protein